MAARNNTRALKVIRSLHTRQKKQGSQINILCQDMVSAHRDFSAKLAALSFAASYYESLLGCTNLEELLDTAVQNIRKTIKEADAAVFLLSESGFDVHMANAGISDPVEKRQFRSWFTRELVNSVSRMNRVCSLNQLLRMGLQGTPAVLRTISLAAIPLGQLGQAVGFVLVYRPAHLPLQTEELSRLAAISSGLHEAIASYQHVSAGPL